jgi:hypothetical protein
MGGLQVINTRTQQLIRRAHDRVIDDDSRRPLPTVELGQSGTQALGIACVRLDRADLTVAGLGPYGQQRAERLRRMRRVSRTYAALMTTFTAGGRARRSRYCAASRAGRDDLRTALGAIWVGLDRLPVHAFSDQLQIATGLTPIAHESRLTESDNLRVASWGHSRAPQRVIIGDRRAPSINERLS